MLSVYKLKMHISLLDQPGIIVQAYDVLEFPIIMNL